MKRHHLLSCVMVVGLAENALAADESDEEPAAAKPAAGASSEPDIAADVAHGDYLRALHQRVHRRWADNFLHMATTQLPRTDAINDPSRLVVIDVILARGGVLVDASVAGESGARGFDEAAVEVLRDSAPFPAPPEDVLSDDGQAHVRWSFARDHRRCSDLAVVQKESAIEVAVPRLFAQNRVLEAWRRVQVAAAQAPEPAVSTFAKAWLRRVVAEPKLAVVASAGLLGAGDPSGVDALKAAVSRGEHIELAAAALVRAHVPVCPLVKAALASPLAPAQEAAVRALRFSNEAECVPLLSVAAGNKKNPVAVRVAALAILGRSSEKVAKDALDAAMAESSPAIRAAAILASARPGGGRAALFRLTPLLRDSSVEVRAAAAAGLLRATGDAALDQLYLLFKETDVRPFEATAVELGGQSSEATALFLGKLLRRDDKRVRAAAAAALAARSDEYARKILATAVSDADVEVRVYAQTAMDPVARRRLASLPSGRRAYRVLVGAGGRGAALDWLLARFDDLDAAAKVEVLGEWLAGPAGATVATQ